MPWSSLDPLLAAGLTLLAVGVLLVLRARLRRHLASRVARRRAARSLRGEGAAESLLASLGYRIIARQQALTWTIRWGDDEHDVDLRADLVVERDGRRLIAEVKTGEAAPSLTSAATRRQLLEYCIAYEADGVILVDPESGDAREVDFFLG